MKISPVVVLCFAVLVVSTAAILVRGAQGEGLVSLAIAAWRMTFAAAALLLVTLPQRKYRQVIAALDGKIWWFCALSSAFLAAHFATWTSSLAYTSVASSVALVTTNPIWIALASWFLFREKIGRWMLAGIVAAITGSLVILWADAGGQAQTGSNPMLGNALAILGAMTVSGYLLVGRHLGKTPTGKPTIDTLLYVTIVYSFAAIFLMVIAAGGAGMQVTFSGYSTAAWLCLIGLAIGPQLIGHTSINWSLRHLSPAFVAVAILAEPVGAALWAYWLFGEHVSVWQVTGFGLVIVGILMAARDRR